MTPWEMEQKITDDDRVLLNSAITTERQAQWVEAQVKRARRELEILELLQATVEKLHKTQKEEIKKRELGTVYRMQLNAAGLARGM